MKQWNQTRYLRISENSDNDRMLGYIDLEDINFAWMEGETLKIALRNSPATQQFASPQTSKVIMDALIQYRKQEENRTLSAGQIFAKPTGSFTELQGGK